MTPKTIQSNIIGTCPSRTKTQERNPTRWKIRDSSLPWRSTRNVRPLCSLTWDTSPSRHRPETLVETSSFQGLTEGTGPPWQDTLGVKLSRRTTRHSDRFNGRNDESTFRIRPGVRYEVSIHTWRVGSHRNSSRDFEPPQREIDDQNLPRSTKESNINVLK